MKGMYFINDRICLNGLTKEESFEIQEQAILRYIQEHAIDIPRMNPYQLHDYYTTPHALLYDLKKEQLLFDCILIYSMRTMEDFIYSYPAKWLIIKSYFQNVILIEEINARKIG